MSLRRTKEGEASREHGHETTGQAGDLGQGRAVAGRIRAVLLGGVGGMLRARDPSHADGYIILARVQAANAGGFLTPAEVEGIAADRRTRLTLLLVRCGKCRFLAPAQDVAHLIALVESGHYTGRDEGEGQRPEEITDYVRDVSLAPEGRQARDAAQPENEEGQR